MSAAEKPISGKEEIKRYLEESTGLERDLLAEKEKSRRSAWVVASVAMVMAVLGVVAGIAGLSQESPVPVVLRVDNATGAVEELSIQKVSEVSYGEIVDGYFLNQYILNREGYEYRTIQKMYDLTRLMSAQDAWQSYNAMYTGQNARDVVLSNRTEIIVRVRSIATNPDTGIATVRYTTQKKHTNGRVEPVENWIATVGYTYVRAIMTTEERRINPLGFVVNTFRADPEVIRN